MLVLDEPTVGLDPIQIREIRALIRDLAATGRQTVILSTHILAEVAACHTQLVHALALPSGYQRDLQVTKGPLFLALNKSLEALALIPALVAEIDFDEARCAAAVDAGMLATDDAIERAKAGTPFREAYKEAARAIGELDESELTARARASIEARVSLGAPGALGLERLEARLAKLSA